MAQQRPSPRVSTIGFKTSFMPLTLPQAQPQCASCSYPGEVSRLREARALEKCRVSQSFTSRSRICMEGAKRGSEGPIPHPPGLPGKPASQDTAWHKGTWPRAALGGWGGNESCQGGRVWVFMSCPFKDP